jgi:hypothetical protein
MAMDNLPKEWSGDDEISPLKHMLKLIDVNNTGQMYEHHINSAEGVIAAREKLRTRQSMIMDTIDKKSMEIFGTSMQHVIMGSDLNPLLTLKYTYQGKEEIRRLTLGELLYLYIVNEISIGRAKLEMQGIDEDKISEIEDALGDRTIAFGNWVLYEFLPKLHDEYNETHRKIYWNSMFIGYRSWLGKNVFFPLICEDEDITKKVRESYENDIEVLPETIVGQFERNRLDLLVGINAFELLATHLDEMEEWNAYARIRHDFDRILRNKQIKIQIEENHKGAHEMLKKAVKIATLTNKTSRVY